MTYCFAYCQYLPASLSLCYSNEQFCSVCVSSITGNGYIYVIDRLKKRIIFDTQQCIIFLYKKYMRIYRVKPFTAQWTEKMWSLQTGELQRKMHLGGSERVVS